MSDENRKIQTLGSKQNNAENMVKPVDDPRVRISRSETDDRLYFLLIIGKIIVVITIFTIKVNDYANSEHHSDFLFWQEVSDIWKQVMSLLVSHVSCLSPWAQQNFSASARIEQTLSHRLEGFFFPSKTIQNFSST